jgi:saccharopine dehydrogenase-like NADP-dependent oxidoreductase
MTKQDVVLVFVSVIGTRNGRLEQESYAKKIYAQEVNGQLLSAIQLTTASGICAMVDMVVEGKLPQKGMVRQEQATLADFTANRFGRYYAL